MILAGILAVGVILFLNWCYEIHTKNKILSKIPGPPPIPYFGYRLPSTPFGFYKMFNELTCKYGKTFKLYIGSNLYVCTSDIKLLEAIMTSNVHLNKSKVYDILKAWLKNGLIVSFREYWRPRRKIVSPSFHFNIMKEFFKVFKEASSRLVEKLKQEADTGKVFNIIEYLQKCSLDVVCKSVLGVNMNFEKSEGKQFVKAINDMCEIAFERNFSPWKRFDILYRLFGSTYEDCRQSVQVINDLTMNVVKQRRADIKAGKVEVSRSSGNKYTKNVILLDALFEYPSLTNEDIQEELINFMFAGYDTISTSLSFAMLNLSLHKDIQEKLYNEINSITDHDINNLTVQSLNEMKYVDQFFRESLRTFTTVPFIERELAEDADLNGVYIPKGTTMSLLIHWMHHDSDVHSNPETFDIERFSSENQRSNSAFAFLPFSAGPRNCVGQKFALMEAKTLLVGILSEFEILSVEGFKIELGLATLLTSKNGFPVRLQRRT
nr:cytochrome P450 [Agasicles hygrophila]